MATNSRRSRRQLLKEIEALRAEVAVTGWLTLVYFEQVVPDQAAVLAKAEALAARLERPRDGDPGEDLALMLRTLRRRLDQLGFRLTRPADERGALQ